MKMMEMLERQDSLYQPGNFWREASNDMLEELLEHNQLLKMEEVSIEE